MSDTKIKFQKLPDNPYGLQVGASASGQVLTEEQNQAMLDTFYKPFRKEIIKELTKPVR